MFSLFSKKVSDADKQVDDLVKKLGDALAVMSGIDDAQKRQIAELERALDTERNSNHPALKRELSKLHASYNDLMKENYLLRKSLERLIDPETPDQFKKRIDKSAVPVRMRNALRGIRVYTYLDLFDVEETHLKKIMNVGSLSIKALKHHLLTKFPHDHEKFKILEGKANDPH